MCENNQAFTRISKLVCESSSLFALSNHIIKHSNLAIKPIDSFINKSKVGSQSGLCLSTCVPIRKSFWKKLNIAYKYISCNSMQLVCNKRFKFKNITSVDYHLDLLWKRKGFHFDRNQPLWFPSPSDVGIIWAYWYYLA